MNFKLTIIILFISFSGYTQEIYTNGTATNILFLGEYNDKNELKVLLNDSIQFVDQKTLQQTNQHTQKEFLKILDSLNLSFICSGFEPFWDFRLKGNKAWFHDFNGKKEHFTITLFVDEFQSSSTFMFTSFDQKLFGIIIDKGIKNDEPACNISSTENNSVYEIYVTYNGKMYMGCGVIGIDYK